MTELEPHPAFRCPVCRHGLDRRPYAEYTGVVPDGAAAPYEDWLGVPSYDVCPGCGFEFGNDDEPGTGVAASFDQYRRDWVAAGSPRFRK